MQRVTAPRATWSPRPVSSRHNALVEEYRRLGHRPRPGETRILLDGLHLVQDARRAGLPILSAAVTTARLREPGIAHEAEALAAAGVDVFAVSEPVLAWMSPVRTPSGIVAIAKRSPVPLERAFATRPALVVVAIDVQDPGNVGALVRAAEAGRATGIIAAGASADPFSWKSLRGSMGSAFRLPIASGLRCADAVGIARHHGLQIVATDPRGGRSLFEVNLKPPTALVIGNEGSGLPPDLAASADALVTIPMQSPVESLNVAVAGALLVYEAHRQRSTHES